MPDQRLWVLALLLIPAAAGHGDETHTEPAWRSPDLYDGDTFTRTFDARGEYGFFDEATGQDGVVRVVADGDENAAATITEGGFEPATIHIGEGGSVTWTVEDAEGWHTVVSTDEAAEAPAEDSPGAGMLLAIGLVGLVGLLRR